MENNSYRDVPSRT